MEVQRRAVGRALVAAQSSAIAVQLADDIRFAMAYRAVVEPPPHTCAIMRLEEATRETVLVSVLERASEAREAVAEADGLNDALACVETRTISLVAFSGGDVTFVHWVDPLAQPRDFASSIHGDP